MSWLQKSAVPWRVSVPVVFAAFFVSLLVSTFFVAWTNGRIMPGVTVAGQPIGGMMLPEAGRYLARYAEKVQHRKIMLSYPGKRVSVSPGAIGIQTDVRTTLRRAYRVGRNGSFFERLAERWRVRKHGREIAPVFKNDQATLDTFFRYLEPGIAIEPIRSVVTLGADDQVTYTGSRVGRSIVREALILQIQQAIYQTSIHEIAIPVKTEVPALTEAQIGAWQLDRILGSFTTHFNPANTDRTHNLELALNAINNVLVYPGQKFSFNDRVGPRVPASGYKEAPVVFLGKLVPGVGGGVCQVSTTLYNAVLMGNLKVTRRINHSLPSAYAPLGQDATVSYGNIDFVFENNYPTPVLVVTRLIPPNLTVAVLGKKTNWETVALETNLLETYPFGTKEIPDPSLRSGERVKASPGVKGYKVELWRSIFYSDGTSKRQRENVSIYPAQPEEYKVGTKDGKVEKAANTVQ